MKVRKYRNQQLLSLNWGKRFRWTFGWVHDLLWLAQLSKILNKFYPSTTTCPYTCSRRSCFCTKISIQSNVKGCSFLNSWSVSTRAKVQGCVSSLFGFIGCKSGTELCSYVFSLISESSAAPVQFKINWQFMNFVLSKHTHQHMECLGECTHSVPKIKKENYRGRRKRDERFWVVTIAFVERPLVERHWSALVNGLR